MPTDDVVDVALLRRAATRLQVPPRPWCAVELTGVEVDGEPEWDPDLQPSYDAHLRELQRAREHVVNPVA